MLTPPPVPSTPTETPAGITTNSPSDGSPQPPSSSSLSSSLRVPRVFFPPLPPSSNNQQVVPNTAAEKAHASSAQEATTSTPAPPDRDVEGAASGEAARGATPLVVVPALPFAAASVQASISIAEPFSTSKVEVEEEAWDEESARGWMRRVLRNASSSGGRCHSFESPRLLDDLRDGTALCDLLNALLEVDLEIFGCALRSQSSRNF